MVLPLEDRAALEELHAVGGRLVCSARYGWHYPEAPEKDVVHPQSLANLFHRGLIEPKTPRANPRRAPRHPEEFIITSMGRFLLDNWAKGAA